MLCQSCLGNHFKHLENGMVCMLCGTMTTNNAHMAKLEYADIAKGKMAKVKNEDVKDK